MTSRRLQGKGAGRRVIPRAGRDAKDLMGARPTATPRTLLPPKPAADGGPVSAQPIGRRRKRSESPDLDPEEPGAFGHDRPELRDEQSHGHVGRTRWCEFPRVSSPTDENARTTSDRMEEMPGHRSERHREQMEGVARRIKFAREEAGLSQTELSKRSGVDRSIITRLEAGEVLEISTSRFFELCQALSLDPVYVWTGQTRAAAKRHSSTPPPPESVQRPSSRPKGR